MNLYHGYLLGITELPSGDAFLKFFTREMGLVSIMCRKLSASKKRKPHLDFFRLLEVEATPKNILRSVQVKFVHDSFMDYTSHQLAFEWLEKLAKTMPEEKSFEGMFHVLTQVLSYLSESTRDLCDVYFRLHLLEESGHIHRFDTIRTDCYFRAQYFSFHEEEVAGALFLPNKVRQFLEYIRRSSLEDLLSKSDSFDVDMRLKALNILRSMEEYHLS